MMKIIVKTFQSISESYKFLNKITLEGQEPLRLLPLEEGCIIIARVLAPTAEPFFELSEEVLKAYLGLNDGKVQKNIAVIDSRDLTSCFKLAQELHAKGILINEIRNFKKWDGLGYLIVSHDDKNLLSEAVIGHSHTLLETKNTQLMNFLGLSDITIN